MSISGSEDDHVRVLQLIDDILGVAKRYGGALQRDDLDALYEAVRTLDYIARRIHRSPEGNPERSGGAPAPLG